MEEALAVLINVSLADSSHKILLSAEFPYIFDKDFKAILTHNTMLARIINFCSKMSRVSGFLLQLLQANNVVVHLFVSTKPTVPYANDCMMYSSSTSIE